VVDRIDFDDDDVEWGDDLRLEYRGAPFTGEAVETVAGLVIGQSFFVDGIENGMHREWWMNGRLKAEGEIRSNTGLGTYREWHENGQLATEKNFDGMGHLVTVRTWDAAGNPIEA
jgi:hypothetical protein